MTNHWEHVGRYRLPDNRKWVSREIEIDGLAGASLIEAPTESGATDVFLVVAGQMFRPMTD